MLMQEGALQQTGLGQANLLLYAAGCTWLRTFSPVPCRQAAKVQMQAVTCGP